MVQSAASHWCSSFESVDRHLNVIPIRGIRVSYGQDVAIPVERLSNRRITSHHGHASVQRAFACAISLLDDPPDEEERKQAGDCEPDNLQNSKPPCRKCCRRFRRRYGNQIAAAMPADDGGLLNLFCAELAFLHEGAAISCLVPLAWHRATRREFANRIHPRSARRRDRAGYPSHDTPRPCRGACTFWPQETQGNIVACLGVYDPRAAFPTPKLKGTRGTSPRVHECLIIPIIGRSIRSRKNRAPLARDAVMVSAFSRVP
jgi:hypothetical protein